MPESFVALPPDSTGKKQRTRERAIGANQVHESYVIPISERVVTARSSVSTFRTLGAAAVSQNLFSIENGSASTINLAIRRMSLQVDATAALLAVSPVARTSRPTALPTGGTALAKVSHDGGVSATPVVARGGNAADGGAATAIVATAGAGAWAQYLMRVATAVGQMVYDDASLIPSLSDSSPIILLPGQALLVQITAAATTSNPATNHYLVNCAWDEFVPNP